MDFSKYNEHYSAFLSRYGIAKAEDRIDGKIAYDYPEGLDLSPESDLHKELVGYIMMQAIESQGKVANRTSSWEEIDRVMNCYIAPSDADEENLETNPYDATKIVIPQAFANKQTIMSYYAQTFLQVDPLINYTSLDSKDGKYKGALMSAVVQMQNIRFRNPIELMAMWSNSITYGVGPVLMRWEDYKWSVPRIPSQPFSFAGTKITAINPYNYLPDPNIPVQRVRDGNFQGFVSKESIFDLMMWEEEENSAYFNVKYLENMRGIKSALDTAAGVGGSYKKDSPGEYELSDINYVDIVYAYIRLRPSDVGMEGDLPEYFFVAIANDQILIALEKVGTMLPFAVDAPLINSLDTLPQSLLETTQGLQVATDNLWNLHFQNLRQAVNNIIVADPKYINWGDLMENGGMRIRARKAAFGTDLKGSIFQLPVNDVTRGNLDDMQLLNGLSEEILGSTDRTKGVRRNATRMSATEAGQLGNSALSRLELYGIASGWTSLYDIAQIMAVNTVQHMEDEMFLEATDQVKNMYESVYGEKFPENQDGVRITPENINYMYDIIPSYGLNPRAVDVQSLTTLFSYVASNELLAQRFDIGRLFKYIAHKSGAVDIEKLEFEVKSNEEVISEADKGNLVPATGGLE